MAGRDRLTTVNVRAAVNRVCCRADTARVIWPTLRSCSGLGAGQWSSGGSGVYAGIADTCGQSEARVRFDLLGLEEPVRREVLAVAASRSFARGMVVFHEGEAGGSLHVLMRGRASVWVTTP